MDALDVGLLILAGLNAVVWGCVWQHGRGRFRWPWPAWLRDRLWGSLAGPRRAARLLVARGSRGAQPQPPSVGYETHLALPCVLCGNPRHRAQEHILLPQRELERRAGR